MNILIIGAGVIGITYGWQFSKAGDEVTFLVRPERKKLIESKGLIVNCTDLRTKHKKQIRQEYYPKVIDHLESAHNYELIIVAVKRNQLVDLLPRLKDCAKQADILFFQNNWSGTAEINKYLEPHQYLFGFPHMVGGGRSENCIETIIFGGSSRTVIGEINGELSERLLRIKDLFSRAGMKPKISKKIVDWLITHYIQQSSGVGVFIKHGSPPKVLADLAKIKEMCVVAREGLNVCKARGINPITIFPINMLYLPIFLLTRAFKKMFSDENEMAMIEGHMNHGIDEMIIGFYEVLKDGRKHKVPMEKWESLKPFVDKYCLEKGIQMSKCFSDIPEARQQI